NVPQQLKIPVDLAMNTKLINLFKSENVNVLELRNILEASERIDTGLDLVTLNYLANAKVSDLMERLHENPQDLELIKTILQLLDLIEGSPITPEYWEAQNLAFTIRREKYEDLKSQEESGQSGAEDWRSAFDALLQKLHLIT